MLQQRANRERKPPEGRAISSTNIVRKDFVKYLKDRFVLEEDWVHPTTGYVFTHQEIKDHLVKYKDISPKYYNALYSHWLGLNPQEISERFLVSQSTLKRRWQKAVNDLLLLLIFPQLTPEDLDIYVDRV